MPTIIIASGETLTGLRAWAYAAGAMYHVGHGLPVNAVAPEAKDTRTAETLKRDWGIEGRDDLIDAMVHLGIEGHRFGNLFQLRYFCAMWRPAVASYREECRAAIREVGEDNESVPASLWRLDAVQADWNGIRSSPLLAFDAARGIMLARDGLMLGWLGEDEAWRYMTDVARDIRRTYPSWEAYGRDFILARNVWASDASPDAFDAVVTELLRHPRSPWRTIGWDVAGLEVPRSYEQAGDDAPLYWWLEQR